MGSTSLMQRMIPSASMDMAPFPVPSPAFLYSYLHSSAISVIGRQRPGNTCFHFTASSFAVLSLLSRSLGPICGLRSTPVSCFFPTVWMDQRFSSLSISSSELPDRGGFSFSRSECRVMPVTVVASTSVLVE